MVLFSPVVETEWPGAFMTKHPRDERTETSLEIPFLTGVTYDEGLMKSLRKLIATHSFVHLDNLFNLIFFYSIAIFNVPGLFDEFVSYQQTVLPIVFYYDHKDVSVQKSITDKISEFYFNDNLSWDSFANVTNVM